MEKKVLILHSNVPENAPPDEMDVFEEAAYVTEVLTKMGYSLQQMPFGFNIGATIEEVRKINPDFVFNLVETMDGKGNMIHIAPFIFNHFKIPYTGNPYDAMYNTSNKLVAKMMMKSIGIPTPKFISLAMKDVQIEPGEKFLIKSAWEHASVSIDERNLKFYTAANRNELFEELEKLMKEGKESYAEKYIEGREFNISIIGGKDGPEVLPLAEMQFLDFPPDMPKIMGYRAKWDESSFEYSHTARTFEEKPDDDLLRDELRKICIRCWKAFNLRGYARVDFRVTQNNQPLVLEINANPCISPDSGFISACREKGMTDEEIFTKIIEDINY